MINNPRQQRRLEAAAIRRVEGAVMMGCRGCVSSVLVTCGFSLEKNGFCSFFSSFALRFPRSFGAKRGRFHKRSFAAGGSHCKREDSKRQKQAAISLALAGLVFSLYLGSAWYDRMLTSHVTKKVRTHIAASTAKKD